MLTHVCVAIQLLGSMPAPEAVQALQQRCGGILGPAECRLASTSGDDDACWRATVARTADDSAASVLVHAPSAASVRAAQRDLAFQPRDELTERWATIGLVIAALVTLQEHSAEANDAVAPEPTPPSRPWFSRDRSQPPPLALTEERGADGRAAPRLDSIRLLAIYDNGRVPGTGYGARLQLMLQLARYLDVQVGGSYVTSTGTATIPVASGATGGGRFSLWSMALGICPHPQSRFWRLGGHVCGGYDLSATTATGFGVAETASATAWVNNLWLGFDLELTLTRHLALVADYKTERALSRPVFTIDGAGTVYQPAPYALNVSLGIAAVF